MSVSTYLSKDIFWRGIAYHEGICAIPQELAIALGMKLEEPKAEGEQTEATPNAELFELLKVGDVLTADVLVDGLLNLDAKNLTAAQMAELPGISEKSAAELLASRPVNGYNTFIAFEKLARGLGYTRLKFEQLSRRVVFQGQ